jgi:predicted aspartyl protease
MTCVPFWMLLAAPAAVADAPPPVSHYRTIASTPPAADPSASAKLAMTKDSYERMTVAVRLGAHGPYRFLVDTGSDRTSVSLALARKLGLAEQPGALMHSATGSSNVRMAHLPELQTGRRAVRHINAPLLDAADMGADGILGIDSLRSQRVVFDFANQSLSIHSDKAPALTEEGAILVRARRRDGRLVITDAEVDGEKVSVVIDTGSSLTIGNAALRRRLDRHGRVESLRSIDLISVTGAALRGELANVRSLEIGGARLEGLTLVVADAHTFGQLGLQRKPALLLGMNALRGFDQVAIDFAGKTLLLVLPKGRKTGGG